jgi:hypothetical protein
MATITVSTNQGTLDRSGRELLNQTAPFADLNVKSRMETALNIYGNVNNAVSNDYLAGGFLNFGFLPNGQYKVDLDGYELWYTGTLSQRGSLVTSIDVLNRMNGDLVRIEGNIAYTGLPFFTSVGSTSPISALYLTNASSTVSSLLLVEATINPSSIIAGKITTTIYQFVNSSGNLAIRDFTGGGNVTFTNAQGSFNVLSGGFTESSIDTRGYPLINPDTTLDYIAAKGFFMPISASAAMFDVLAGSDTIYLIGSRGSLVYAGDGNDIVNGSLYADTIYTETGNDFIIGGGGNDIIDGGAGTDAATYLQARVNYVVSTVAGGYRVAGPEGTDTLTNIENVVFSDGTFSLSAITAVVAPTIVPGVFQTTNAISISTGSPAVSSTANDLITGNTATNVVDAVAYKGSIKDYKVAMGSNGNYTVIDAVSSRDGSDVVVNVERLKFSPDPATGANHVALDLSPAQSSGQTALLIGAVLPGKLAFDASKQALLGSVIGLFDQGFTLAQLSGAILRLPIWDVLTGKAAPTNADIAGYLVNNVYGGTQTAAITNAAIAAMNAETPATQGNYLASLAASAASQNHIDLVGIQSTGLVYVG